MRNFFYILFFSLVLVGCVSLPQTPEDLKSMSSSSSLVASNSYTVSRAFLEVNESLEEGGQRCLNKTQRKTSSTPGKYGPVVSTTETRYVTRFQASETAGQLSMRMIPILGRALNEPEEGYIYLVVETRPAGAATNVTVYASSVGDSSLKAAIQSWAQTGEISCPELIR